MGDQEVVVSSDVPIMILQKKIKSAKTLVEAEKLKDDLNELMRIREVIQRSVMEIIKKSTNSEEQTLRVQTGCAEVTNHKMYREVIEYYKVKCFNWHDSKVFYRFYCYMYCLPCILF
ncbi:Legumain [Acipenser ruthenus]|uniref:Legumain n=1 Tax=Acipenser ruthenus TaxID=7906 RepID=A0A444UY44_ACIRT|nr:Legumain [Acipenser ruthenus]